MEMTEAFLAMGIDELSVSPACVLPLRKKSHNLRQRKTGRNLKKCALKYFVLI